MKRSLFRFVATLASVAAGVQGSSEPRSVALGESFTLKVGESAQIVDESLKVGFEEVSADSRCPKGERCISEGDATIRVWLRRASEAKETHDLHTSSKAQGPASYLGYEVNLGRLDPFPITGRTIAREDYVVTLVVTRGSSSASDR